MLNIIYNDAAIILSNFTLKLWFMVRFEIYGFECNYCSFWMRLGGVVHNLCIALDENGWGSAQSLYCVF